MMTDIGIERISFYIPRTYLDLSTLAQRSGADPDKFLNGIGQHKNAIPPHDEDVVTMAAEAAHPIIEACGSDGIDTLLFATESGIDQSKSAGLYVSRLLNLPRQCRNVELKQACYSATAALQMACGYVTRKPERKVLIIASDVARYDLDSPGEATQGAGAVAMLISATPNILTVEPVSGCYSEDIMDFWRPNYRKTPLVDGKYSAIKYLHALKHAWADYQDNGGRAFNDFGQFCYHLPFSRMAEKAQKHLATLNQAQMDRNHIKAGMTYNRDVGNCYSAALYLSLISMLETYDGDLADQAIGLFSYGSGATAEFFSGTVSADYKDYLFTQRHQALLHERTALGYEEYLEYWHAPDPQNGAETLIPQTGHGRYKLTKIDNHKRHYECAA